MASSNLTVTIQHNGYVEIAKSSNLRTIQKCLSLIADEQLASPPSAEALALEVAEKQLEDSKTERFKLECRIKELETRMVSSFDAKITNKVESTPT